MAINQLPYELRPREKALCYGIESLSDVELLAIIIQTGTRKVDALDLSKKLIEKNDGLLNLSNSKIKDIYMPGIKKAKALKLLACFEINKRIQEKKILYNRLLLSKDDIYQTFGKDIAYNQQESLIVVLLDSNNRFIRMKKISSCDESFVEAKVKLLLKFCIEYSASKVYLLHNHPSKCLEPSEKDIQTTLILASSLKMVGICLLDHLVVTTEGYYSITEEKIYKLKTY